MTLNPPNAVEIIRHYQILVAAEIPSAGLVFPLAMLFRRLLLPTQQTYEAFLGFYHGHLQVIPLELAKQAWGLMQAASFPPADPSNPTTTES